MIPLKSTEFPEASYNVKNYDFVMQKSKSISELDVDQIFASVSVIGGDNTTLDTSSAV